MKRIVAVLLILCMLLPGCVAEDSGESSVPPVEPSTTSEPSAASEPETSEPETSEPETSSGEQELGCFGATSGLVGGVLAFALAVGTLVRRRKED